MGTAYFIVLERDIEGLNTMMDGKRLAQSVEVLDALASHLGVRPISEFVSTNPEPVAEFTGGEPGNIELPPLKQFSAQEGLATVRALLTKPESQPAMHDLQNCERILNAADRHGVGWHFEVDV